MTIRARLVWGMITIGALFLVPLIVGVFTLEHLRDQMTQMRDREFAASVLLARVRSNVDVLRRAEASVALEATPAARADIEAQAAKLYAMGSLLDSYGLAAAADSLRISMQEIQRLLPDGFVSTPALATGASTAVSSQDVATGALNRADRAIGAAERSLRESTDRRVTQVAAAMQNAELLLLLTLLFAAALTAVVAVRLSGFVDRPLKALERGMGEVADGRFDQSLEIPPDRGDEFGRLAKAFTSMARRLKELEQMRASWLAMGTHELKNEVGPIIGYMDLLTDGVLGPLAPKQIEKCLRTKTLAERLKGHLLKYLAVSKMESGSNQLSVGRFELALFIDEIESDFAVMAAPRSIGFSVSKSPSLPRWVTWDRESVREVMENLLSNAFKFTPPGGTVTVTAGAEDGGVRLTVRDSGVGIPQDDVDHIFAKYFKAKNQSHSNEKGTGLGLAIAREIIKAHGGSISCTSAVGTGTTFTLTLPTDCGGSLPVTYAGDSRRVEEKVAVGALPNWLSTNTSQEIHHGS